MGAESNNGAVEKPMSKASIIREVMSAYPAWDRDQVISAAKELLPEGTKIGDQDYYNARQTLGLSVGRHPSGEPKKLREKPETPKVSIDDIIKTHRKVKALGISQENVLSILALAEEVGGAKELVNLIETVRTIQEEVKR